MTEGQTNDAALIVAFPGNAVNISFRGSEYTCLVEGGSIASTPGNTVINYNLTLMTQNKFNFTLSSTYYGVLNTNQLG
jgi:hypothetical protein